MRKNSILIIAIPLTFILLCFVVYEYIFLEVRAEKADAEELHAVKSRSLEKFKMLIARKPQLEERLALLEETRKADNSKIIDGQTVSLAAATLQDTVKANITGRGGTISSERIEKPEEFGKFKIISVSFDAIIPDAKALSEILFALETQVPFLIIREIDARVRNFRDPRDLLVKLKISALTDAR